MQFSKPFIAGVVVIIILIAAFFIFDPLHLNSGPYDSFAQCLTQKGVKMYGAFWCPHCQEQKAQFGNSMKYVNYIECSSPDGNSQLPVCAAQNITGYPTWDFGNGQREQGLMTFAQLSNMSGCPLPASASNQ